MVAHYCLYSGYEVKIDVDKDEILERTADSRGRVTLGKEYSNKQVQLVVFEKDDPVSDELAKELAEILEENPELVERLSDEV